MKKYVKKIANGLVKKSVLLASLWFLVISVSVAYKLLENSHAVLSESEVAASAWGAEALQIVEDEVASFSLIKLANACGLGASSCFRCHDGRRAKVQDVNEETSPWHAQHNKVNYSCAGCHQGNPRILRQELAHKNLIVNPLTATDKTCASCHDKNDLGTLSIKYSTHPNLQVK